MKRRSRILVAVALCGHLAGCTTYRAVPWCPPDLPAAPESDEGRCEVDPGDRIRLTFVDGERLECKLVAWDADGITVLRGAWGSERGDARRFARDEIAGVEKVGINRTALGIGLVVVGGLIVGLVMVSETMDDFGIGG